MSVDIPGKTSRVLNIVLLGLLLVFIRVWYLSVVQHEEKLQESRKPKRRTVIEHAQRGTIRDRFNIPLAINKIKYNATISYAPIRQIPSVTWKKDAQGKSIKTQSRLAYISRLAEVLGKELDMETASIEDMIHGKAALFPHASFILKEEITEAQYFRLKMLEREWPGLSAQRLFKRVYPQGKIGCDVIGYMGAISQEEHVRIAQEIKELEAFISEREEGKLAVLPEGFDSPLAARKRLKELQEKAYTIHDMVGKSGIEASFDEQLRGFYGKRIYEIDTKGDCLRELPSSRKAIAGQRIVLSISAELQAYAESLLAKQEKLREEKDLSRNKPMDLPWMRGGAIVALIPDTGEVVALASYPRFDPSDFIPSQTPILKEKKQSAILKWLESESYIGEIWDGKQPLQKEWFDFASSSYEERAYTLSWELYLSRILSHDSPLHAAMEKARTVAHAFYLQIEAEKLLALSGQTEMRALMDALYVQGHKSSRLILSDQQKKTVQARLKEQEAAVLEHKKHLDLFLSSIPFNDDKVLFLDLCHLLVNTKLFSEDLIKKMGSCSLSAFHKQRQAIAALKTLLKPAMQEVFHKTAFNQWRHDHFKLHLQEKRKQEKEKKQYAKPYTEYLELAEKKMFRDFWEVYQFPLIEAFVLKNIHSSEEQQSLLQPYFAALGPLLKNHPEIVPSVEIIKPFLSALSLPYLQTLRTFSQLDRPLLGRYPFLKSEKGVQLEKHLASAFYPKTGFGYGRSQAFRQSTPVGSVFKLVTAYEALRERTLSFKTPLNPLTLIDHGEERLLGETLEGEPILRMYKGGRMPRSSYPHMGQVDLIGALEQSSNIYFSILAGECIEDPSYLTSTTRLFGFGSPTGIDLPGEFGGKVPTDLSHNRTGLYSFAIGQHSLVVTPLQTAVMTAAMVNNGIVIKPKIVKVIAGKEPSPEKEELFSSANYPFKEDLSLAGISFPLFTEPLANEEHPYVYYPPTEVQRQVFFSSEIRNILFRGMHQILHGQRGTVRPALVRLVHEDPKAIRDYMEFKDYIIGKTGTAEILYRQHVDAAGKPEMKKHVWFSAIAFPKPHTGEPPWDKPELIIVVYLRFGDAGRWCAPLAAQVLKKWHELKLKYGVVDP